MSRLGLSLIMYNIVDQILVELCRILFGGRMAQNYYLIYLPSKKWEEVASIASSNCKNGRYIIKYTRDMPVKAAQAFAHGHLDRVGCKTHLTLWQWGRWLWPVLDRAVQVHVAKVVCIKICDKDIISCWAWCIQREGHIDHACIWQSLRSALENHVRRVTARVPPHLRGQPRWKWCGVQKKAAKSCNWWEACVTLHSLESWCLLMWVVSCHFNNNWIEKIDTCHPMKDLGLSRLFFPSAHVFRNVAATNANIFSIFVSILVGILTWLARTVNWAQRLGKIKDMRSHQHLPKSTATLQLSKMVLYVLLSFVCTHQPRKAVGCRDCHAFEPKSDEDLWRAPLVPSIMFLSNLTLSRPWPLRVLRVSWGYVSHRDDQATGAFVVERTLEVRLYFSLEVQLVTPS